MTAPDTPLAINPTANGFAVVGEIDAHTAPEGLRPDRGDHRVCRVDLVGRGCRVPAQVHAQHAILDWDRVGTRRFSSSWQEHHVSRGFGLERLDVPGVVPGVAMPEHHRVRLRPSDAGETVVVDGTNGEDNLGLTEVVSVPHDVVHAASRLPCQRPAVLAGAVPLSIGREGQGGKQRNRGLGAG